MGDVYLLVAGSRWTGTSNEVKVFGTSTTLDELLEAMCKITLNHVAPYDSVHVVEGGARGIDTKGADWARSNGYDVVEFKADWDVYGKGAGMIRNSEMVKYIKAMENRAAVILWDGESKGTANTIDRVIRANIPYCIYNKTQEAVFFSWNE